MAGVRLAHKDFIIAKDVTNTLQFDNIFSQRYSAYEILGHNLVSSYGGVRDWLIMGLLDANGNIISDGNYQSQRNEIFSNSTSTAQGSVNNSNSWYFSRYTDDSFGTNFRAVVHTPFESDSITMFICESSSNNSSVLYYYSTAGVHQSAERITGFRLYGLTNEVIGGNISVFGIGG